MSHTGHPSDEKAPDEALLLHRLGHRPGARAKRSLTQIERITLAMVADGLSRTEIAEHRAVTVATVKTTLRRVRSVLGPLGAAGLVDLAYRTGGLAVPAYRALPQVSRLDAAQRQLLTCLATGATTVRIAHATHSPGEAVKARVAALRDELGALTNAHAVHIGWQCRALAPTGRPTGGDGLAGPMRPAVGYMRVHAGMADVQVYEDEQKMLRWARDEGYELRAIYYEEQRGGVTELFTMVTELNRADVRTVVVPSFEHFSSSSVLRYHLTSYVGHNAHANVLSAVADR